ncbi:hypothetical protein [Streptomyces sp. CB02460]|nr:hypothetical protein [Streptomyces sp. CB02460]
MRNLEIIEPLLRLDTEQGTTLVRATHDMGIAARCGRVPRAPPRQPRA